MWWKSWKFVYVEKFDVTEKLEVWRKKLKSKQGLVEDTWSQQQKMSELLDVMMEQ